MSRQQICPGILWTNIEKKESSFFLGLLWRKPSCQHLGKEGLRTKPLRREIEARGLATLHEGWNRLCQRGVSTWAVLTRLPEEAPGQPRVGIPTAQLSHKTPRCLHQGRPEHEPSATSEHIMHPLPPEPIFWAPRSPLTVSPHPPWAEPSLSLSLAVLPWS